MALRILDSQDFILFTVGARVTGHLNLGGTKVAVRAQVKHLGAQVVGCQFQLSEMDEKVLLALENFLSPAAMGQAMRLMPSVDDKSLWYHGASGTDLLLGGGNGSVGSDPAHSASTASSPHKTPLYQKLTLYARGSYVQWDHETGLTTGRTESADPHPPGQGEGWGVVRFETTLLKADPLIDAEKLSIAKALILGCKMAPELKNWCLTQLSGTQAKA
jgi:hypothetical protein